MKYFDTIEDLSGDRKNNYDIIRFAAATMVLYSHSYPLSSGVKLEDPLAMSTHFINFGGLGVYIFFLISGFLVTKSYCSRHDLVNFIKARCLRIFPGLIAAMLFSVFVIGAVVTKLPLISYFKDLDTYKYILHNSAMYKIRYYLPGVFAENPYPVVVNGSLWTLPVEFKMYILVAIVGVIGLYKNKIHFNIFAVCGFVLYTVLLKFGVDPIGPVNKLMIMYFILGALVCINRKHIPLHPAIFALLCIVTGLLFKTVVFKYMFPVALTYTVFFIAYYPKIKFNNFGKYGDFSYGMYIYAFPMQQLVASMIKNLSPMELFALAFLATLGPSVLSWKLIEKPAMAFKNRNILSVIKNRGVEA